jgi:hypothetical protein
MIEIPRDPSFEEGVPSDNAASNEQLRHDIGVGMDFEMFTRSTMGRFLASRANADIKDFHIQLEDTDLTAEATALIRFEIRCRRQWSEWIREVIDRGTASQIEAVDRGKL